jgi:tRNA (adenine57-N1/adenine58-N1)-methyltransferase
LFTTDDKTQQFCFWRQSTIQPYHRRVVVTSSHVKANDTVLLISEDGKRFYTRVRPGHRQHTHQGIIEHDDLIDQPLGRRIISTTGHTYIVAEPSVAELMKAVKRKTQIIYPKEAGRIILKLNVFPGRRVIEAGSGSGSLTMALARYVGPTGKVFSYEARSDILENAVANVTKAGLDGYVDFKLHNIAGGFLESDVDAVFLDVKEPWKYMKQVKAALKPSGFFGSIVPTTNQVIDLLLALKHEEFGGVEVEENFRREYKPIPGRLRPSDIMVGHTGYLIFARNVQMDVATRSRQRKIDWLASQEVAERQPESLGAEQSGGVQVSE